jgi:hypothetical protein
MRQDGDEEKEEPDEAGRDYHDDDENIPAPSALQEIQSFVRDTNASDEFEAEKVKILALLRAMRDEINQPASKGAKTRDITDIFVDRFNFFLDRLTELFPSRDFSETFTRLHKEDCSIEKLRLELSLLISYIQNDIMDIIEESARLKEKNKWLQNRIRDVELKVAHIQAIR